MDAAVRMLCLQLALCCKIAEMFSYKPTPKLQSHYHIITAANDFNVKRTIWLEGYQNGNHIEPSEQRLQDISIAKN